MKKISLLIFFLIGAIFAFAQQDTTTVFQSPRGYATDPIRSQWKKRVVREADVWVVSLFDKKNVLQEKVSFADEKLEVRKGSYHFYENGKLLTEGNYEQGYKVGQWNYYDPNGKLLDQVGYLWDRLNGTVKSYWPNGQMKADKQYHLGTLVGECKMFYENGQLALQETYDDKGDLVHGNYFDQGGKVVDERFVRQPPAYPGGAVAFKRFLAQKLRYPATAVKNRIQGTVLLAVTIQADGTLHRIAIKESPAADLSAEAIRVLQLSGKWIPARELGLVVDARYEVPIQFALH